jgi:hypothetical protein
MSMQNIVNIKQPTKKKRFLLDEWRFHNVFNDKPAKWSITKTKKKEV